MGRFRLAGAVTGVRVLVALAALYTAYRGQLLLGHRVQITEGLAYFVVAAGLLIAASLRRGGHDTPDTGAVPATAGHGAASWRKTGWRALVLVTIGVGIFFRLYELNSQPWGVWFDEAQNGIVAQRILTDPNYRPVFIGEWSQLPALFFYVFAAAIKIMGANVLALRSVTTVAGILTLIFLYLLARELFDPRVAVLATFFLGVMRWHVNFSRFAMHGIFMPLFMTATFYFLVRGLRGKGLWNLPVAGIMAGIGLQGYYAFLLVPGVVAIYLLHYVIFQRVLPWGRLIVGTLAVAVMAVAVYAPVGIWAYHHPQVFNQRLGTVSIVRGRTPQQVVQVLWRSTDKHLRMFNIRGDGNGRHNIPGAPMLDPYMGFLFVLGLGFALWRWRDSGHFLLLIWMAIIIQSGIWSLEFEAPQAYRTIGLTPAVAMLAALPLGLLWTLAAECIQTARPGRWPARAGAYALGAAAGVVVVFLLVESARANFDAYFNHQLKRGDVWASFSADATFVGKEVARLSGDHLIYCSPFLAGLPTIRFLAPDAPEPHRLDATRDFPLSGTRPAVVILAHQEEPEFKLLKSYYPNAKFVEFGPPWGGAPIVFEAIISAEEIAATRGLTYRYANGERTDEGRSERLDLDWRSTTPLPLPFKAEWFGLLKVPAYSRYTLEARAPGPVQLLLDGAVVADGTGVARAADLVVPEGLHGVRIKADAREPGTVQLLWTNAGGGLKLVPGTDLFSGPIKRQGLEGSYFSDAAGGGLKFVRIDPFPGGHMHILPLPVPFTIRWRGSIDLPSDGSYRFVVQAVDEGSLSIDGRPLITTPGPNQSADATIQTIAGRHSIEVTYHQRGGSPTYINLLWAPPGQGIQIIPSNVFSPP